MRVLGVATRAHVATSDVMKIDVSGAMSRVYIDHKSKERSDEIFSLAGVAKSGVGLG